MLPPTSGISSMRTSLGELDVAEALRRSDIPHRAARLRPIAHALVEALVTPDLRVVRLQGSDLLLERAADVEPDVRLARAEEEHARDAMLLQLSTAQLFGEEEMIARRDDAIHAAPACGAMIGVC